MLAFLIDYVNFEEEEQVPVDLFDISSWTTNSKKETFVMMILQ